MYQYDFVPANSIISVCFFFLHSCMPSNNTLNRLRQFFFSCFSSVSSFVVTFLFLVISHVLFQKVSLKYRKELLNLENNIQSPKVKVEAVWNVVAHGDAWEGKWRGNWRLERVATTLALYLGTCSIHGLPADPHSSTASSRLNWLPRRCKLTRPFLWKTKSGFCTCAITFQTCSNTVPVRIKTWRY